ncbi:Nin1 binding protein [Pseudocyphellaria aurata]|nr:Nin1 binding protein [Pseudocyphellaria aurata]
MASQNPVHTIVLDAGPILRNDPAISTLQAKCEELVTVPAVIAEIKDKNARSRLEVTWLPFLVLKTPAPESVKVITNFARKTGDLAVLSNPDVQVLALAYEIECQRNGGDWRLRRDPGQKGTNGSPPKKHDGALGEPKLLGEGSSVQQQSPSITPGTPACEGNIRARPLQGMFPDNEGPASQQPADAGIVGTTDDMDTLHLATHDLQHNSVSDHGSLESSLLECGVPEIDQTKKPDRPDSIACLSSSESSDSEGWITPSNIKRHQAKEMNSSTEPISENSMIQVATITTDFAMQRILLQMNLHLLSPALQRVRNIKNYILRCHACFSTTKDMARQFCSNCGKPTLTRVSCSTSQNGKFSIHLKKNMQWNHRGDRFSIPKPVPGAANGKVGSGRGGGKGGWGQELILAEDQKEYVRAMTGQSRKKNLDLMDEDYLPGILTGERNRSGGRPKVGGGRNVNSKKR